MVDESKSKSVEMLWEGNIVDKMVDMVEIPLDYMEAEAYFQLNQGSTLQVLVGRGLNESTWTGVVDPITVLRQLIVRDRS